MRHGTWAFVRWLSRLGLGVAMFTLHDTARHEHGTVLWVLLFGAWVCFWIATEIPKDRS